MPTRPKLRPEDMMVFVKDGEVRGIGHTLTRVNYDTKRGPLRRGDAVEPDPDFPGEYIRKGDFT